MRIAIAHEWLVRYAGSERCVEQMLEEFPDATLLTTLIRRSALPETLRHAQPSFLQALPGATDRHEWLLPLMPFAWAVRSVPDDVDAVVSSSHACAKGVRVPDGVPHVCYCYTPMRYAWDFESERERFPPIVRGPARLAMGAFRTWDRRTANMVSRFVAISTAVAERIRRSYDREAAVVHPPVRTDYFTPGGERGGYFLYVGRLVSYKQPDLVVEAFAGLDHELIVVGEGHLEESLRRAAGPNVTFAGNVDDERLRDLYRGATALVYPANEDFGIVMVEANACGTPVIAAAEGGALDIVDPEVGGRLLETPDVRSIRAAVQDAARFEIDAGEVRRSAERFTPERFRAGFRAVVEEAVAEGGLNASRDGSRRASPQATSR